VLDTTYFFAALIVWAKGSIQSGLAPVGASVGDQAKPARDDRVKTGHLR
jgi:hypothetical protein